MTLETTLKSQRASEEAGLPMSQRPSQGVQWQRWLYKLKHWTLLAFAHAFCLTIATGCLFPLIWMVASSLKTQRTIFSDMSLWVRNPHWNNYYEAWTKGHFGQ